MASELGETVAGGPSEHTWTRSNLTESSLLPSMTIEAELRLHCKKNIEPEFLFHHLPPQSELLQPQAQLRSNLVSLSATTRVSLKIR